MLRVGLQVGGTDRVERSRMAKLHSYGERELIMGCCAPIVPLL